MEEPPILQLAVLQGPRRGQILVCEPQFVIHIGRVMKGNCLALRDPGISQKHLCLRFIHDAFSWCVSDLHTSNGTILNGSPIAASALVPLSDGDVVEIGEKTKLGVKILAPRAVEGDGRGRRVTRRGALLSVNTSAQSKVSAPVRGRRNNATAAVASIEGKEALNPDLVPDSGVEMVRRGTARGRKDTVTGTDVRVLEKEEFRGSVQIEESDQDGEVKVRRDTRRGKSSRVLKELDGNCAVDSVSGVKEAAGAKRKPRARGKGTAASTVSELEKEKEKDVVAVDEEEGNSEEVEVDFEKMTLGEWFDSMEVFLPKMTQEETEKIIGILKEKSALFSEMVETCTDSG